MKSKTEKQPNKDFENICDWFAYNKLIIYILARARLNRSFLQVNED